MSLNPHPSRRRHDVGRRTRISPTWDHSKPGVGRSGETTDKLANKNATLRGHGFRGFSSESLLAGLRLWIG